MIVVTFLCRLRLLCSFFVDESYTLTCETISLSLRKQAVKWYSYFGGIGHRSRYLSASICFESL